MVFGTIVNNISVISWRSVLLVEETGVSQENHRPAASHIFPLFILYLWYIVIFEEIGQHNDSRLLLRFVCCLCISKCKNETTLLTLFQYCMACTTESSDDKRKTTKADFTGCSNLSGILIGLFCF